MRVIGLAGWSGAGKTTLLLKLIPEFGRRGLSVSTLKHAHHAFEIDHPGKDSFEHRAAGAREVLIASGRRWALMHELGGEPEPSLGALLSRLSRVDLVIVEGFKAYGHAQIEVHRAGNGKPLLFRDSPNVVALAADIAVPDASVPVIALDDVEAIADAILAHAQSLEEALASIGDRSPARLRLAQPRRS
jgi:molybdopterin-guanine dinucleotide biosynthesis protein B